MCSACRARLAGSQHLNDLERPSIPSYISTGAVVLTSVAICSSTMRLWMAALLVASIPSSHAEANVLPGGSSLISWGGRTVDDITGTKFSTAPP
eukprot:SAG31_NODE_767_length_12232_cov_6.917827_14_plen_94_part_00